MLVAVRVDEQDRARPQRRRKDQPAVGAEYDKMIAAYGLHERRIRYETGKTDRAGDRPASRCAIMASGAIRIAQGLTPR